MLFFLRPSTQIFLKTYRCSSLFFGLCLLRFGRLFHFFGNLPPLEGCARSLGPWGAQQMPSIAIILLKKSQEAKKQMLSKKIFHLKKQHFEFDVDGRLTFFMRFRNIFSEEITPNPTKSFLRWRSQLDKKIIMVDLWYLVILDLLKNSSFPVFSHILNSVNVYPLNIESESSHRNFETSDKKCGPNLLD